MTHPTRFDNILDLFLIDNPTLVKSVEIKPGIADHDVVLSEILIKPQVNKQKPRLMSMYIYSQCKAVTALDDPGNKTQHQEARQFVW